MNVDIVYFVGGDLGLGLGLAMCHVARRRNSSGLTHLKAPLKHDCIQDRDK